MALFAAPARARPASARQPPPPAAAARAAARARGRPALCSHRSGGRCRRGRCLLLCARRVPAAMRRVVRRAGAQRPYCAACSYDLTRDNLYAVRLLFTMLLSLCWVQSEPVALRGRGFALPALADLPLQGRLVHLHDAVQTWQGASLCCWCTQAWLPASGRAQRMQHAHPHQQQLFALHDLQPSRVVVRQSPHGCSRGAPPFLAVWRARWRISNLVLLIGDKIMIVGINH